MTIARARKLRATSSPVERRLWAILHEFRQRGYHFRRQVPIGPYYADVASHHARLVIEADGQSHGDPAYDAARDAYMAAHGFTVLRISNSDIMTNPEGVFEAVAAHLEAVPALTPTPVPSPQGGGRPRQRKLRKGLGELSARTGAAAQSPASPLRGEAGGGGRDHEVGKAR